MIKIIKLPTSWKNITWEQYEDYLKNPNFLEKWGITSDVLLKHYEFIASCLAFLQETDVEFPSHEISVLDDKFGKYVEYVYLLQNNCELIDLLAVFNEIDFEKRENFKKSKKNTYIYDEIGIVFQIIKQVTESEKALQEHAASFRVPLSREEKAAGVETFSKKWGYYAVIANMAGSILHHKAIEAMPTFEILGRLRYETEMRYINYRILEEKRIEIESKIQMRKRK